MLRKTLLFAALVIAVTAQPAATPLWGVATAASVSSLRADATRDDLYASFSVKNAFDRDVRERLAAGLPVEFVHYVEVARRRPFWPDKTLLRKTITTTVTYDTLTRQYSLSKKVNDEVAETSVAMQEDEVERWMTTVERIRLSGSSQLGGASEGTLYIRVKSQLRKRFVLFFLPWDVETDWEKLKVSLPGEGTARGR